LDPISLAVQLVASVMTLAAQWLYGNKSVLGPAVGLLGQVAWWTIMFQGHLWGLLPANVVMVAIHIRNLIKWNKEDNGIAR
jgi:nicotinamide riboside transporter PnuC